MIHKIPGKPGKLLPPYPVQKCAHSQCRRTLADAGVEAYAYTDLESGKLVIFCDDCARYAELNAPERFAVIPL